MTPELLKLIAVSSVQLAAKQEQAIQEWKLGSADRWSADLVQGSITFDFGAEIVRGRVSLLGSFATGSASWLWGWANNSVPEGVKTAAHRVREMGEAEGALRALAEPNWRTTPEIADDLAAVVVEVADLSGLYRTPSASGYTYLGFEDLERIIR